MFLVLLFVIGIWSTCDDSYHLPLFEEFKENFKKEYESKEEERQKYEVFCINADRAFVMNATYPQTEYGITKFSDLTTEEFKGTWLMKSFNAVEFHAATGFSPAPAEMYHDGDVPDSWNWVDNGLVTSVKNQGECGSCWAFSATANIEGQWAKSTSQLVSLSEQQIVDCDHYDEGCGGGWPDTAFKYVISAGGLESYKDYPYTGRQGQCEFDASKVVAKISSYQNIQKSEDAMESFCYQNGPISVAMNAEQLSGYSSGIYNPKNCNPQDLDHAVLVVGWGVQGSQDYWIIKNSWGTDWGLQGYFWLAKGTGECGIDQAPCSSSC